MDPREAPANVFLSSGYNSCQNGPCSMTTFISTGKCQSQFFGPVTPNMVIQNKLAATCAKRTMHVHPTLYGMHGTYLLQRSLIHLEKAFNPRERVSIGTQRTG